MVARPAPPPSPPHSHQRAWGWEPRTTFVRCAAPRPRADDDSTTTLDGGCHCGAVRFQVSAPRRLVVWDCNCSDCRLRRNAHFIVPEANLALLGTGDTLTEYRWGSGVAAHLFCSICGVSPFYRPRSNPDGWAVTFACLDDGGAVDDVETRHFDGLNWESHIAGAGSAIRAFSRARQEGEG